MASGFVAGGAIMGVIASTIRFIGIQVTGQEGWSVEHALGMSQWLDENSLSAVVTLIAFCGLAYYLYKGARSAAQD